MKRIIQPVTSVLTIMIGLAVCATVARADVKVKSKSGQGASAMEQTTYIKGQRQRVEMAGGMMISLTQCDLKRNVQVNPQTKTYIVTPFNQTTESARPQPNQPRAKATPATAGGLVWTTVTTKDTGERKQLFGYTARRIITTMVTDSSPDACQKVKSKMEIDAWYIDAAFGLDCDLNNRYQPYRPADGGGCQDRFEVKQIGVAAKGYPVWTKTTMFDDNGNASFSIEQEVIEFSQGPLDAALFEVPAGYREVKDFSQAAYGSVGSDVVSAATRDKDHSDMTANVKSMAEITAKPAREVGAKREGVIRLGLPAVKTGSVGDGLNATELAAAVRNTMAAYLKSSTLEVVLIEAESPAQIDLEAKQKQCDFVIYTSVEHKKGGSRFGAALSSVAALGSYSSGSTNTAARNGAAGDAASVSADIKAKDQLTLDLKLQTLDNATTIITRQFKAKAQSNGEDIISPTVGQAAQTIRDAAKK